jgi:hypothetical protein
MRAAAAMLVQPVHEPHDFHDFQFAQAVDPEEAAAIGGEVEQQVSCVFWCTGWNHMTYFAILGSHCFILPSDHSLLS